MVPKFRAWDKEEKRMSYGKIEYYDDSFGVRFDHFCVGADFEVEFMQSTEMDDKIGKEIWHKDILDESYTSPLNGEEVIVRYIVEKENGMWKLKDWKGRQQYDRYLFMRNKQCVKIGNIFQNPELLERADES